MIFLWRVLKTIFKINCIFLFYLIVRLPWIQSVCWVFLITIAILVWFHGFFVCFCFCFVFNVGKFFFYYLPSSHCPPPHTHTSSTSHSSLSNSSSPPIPRVGAPLPPWPLPSNGTQVSLAHLLLLRPNQEGSHFLYMYWELLRWNLICSSDYLQKNCCFPCAGIKECICTSGP